VRVYRLMLYEPPSLLYARVPLVPYERAVHLFEDAVSSAEQIRAELGSRTSAAVDAGVALASPSLMRALRAPAARGYAKALTKYRAYAVRAGTRASPYASFSSVGIMRHGSGESPVIGERAYVASVDMEWVRRFVKRYDEICAYPELILYRNPLTKRYGARLGVIDRRRTHRAAVRQHLFNDEFDPASIAHTEPVRAIETWLRQRGGMTVRSLVNELSARFGVSPERAGSLLGKLYDAGFFISEAWPGPFLDPLAWLIGQAERYDRAVLPDLRRLQELLGDQPSRDALPPHTDRIAATQKRLDPSAEHGIRVDGTVRVTGSLPAAVLEELRTFAGIAVQIAPPPSLRTLRERLYRRHESEERLISLVDIIFAGDGPSAFEEVRLSPRDRRWQEPRAGMLGLFVERHLRSGRREVVLDDLDLKKILYRDAPNDQTLPRTLEIGFQVCAASAQALEAGEFVIVPTGLFSNAAGKSLSRLAHALSPAERSAYDASIAQTIARRPEAVADLVSIPTGEHFSNVVLRPPAAEAVIAVGCVPAGHPGVVLELDDLYVGQDEDRLFVWSRQLGRKLYILKNELTAFETLDPVARTLEAIASHQEADPMTFDWGPLRDLPFLPRLVYRKTVLARARWNFRHDMKQPHLTYDAVVAARERGELDRHARLRTLGGDLMLLDLDSSFGRSMLRHETGRLVGAFATLLEELPGAAWLADADGNTFAPEFVAALHRVETVPSDRLRAHTVRPAARLEGEERRRYPGGEWFYAKLACDAWTFDTVIGGPLRELIAGATAKGLISNAFFLRFGDPLPHLRVRFRLADPSAQSFLAEALASWCADGTLSTFEVGTYVRELERYGTADAIEAAEAVFGWSSARAIDAVRRIASPESRLSAALHATDHIVRAIVGEDEADRWLDSQRAFNVKLRRTEWPIVRAFDAERAEDLEIASLGARYRAALAEQGREPVAVASSLIHMHCNRLGIEHEPRVRAMYYRLVSGRRARETQYAEV
jgi:lantibiotic biosynthesis protein